MADSKDKSLLEMAEDAVSDSYDRERQAIPSWDDVGRVKHDVEVGIMKGVYGGAKSLISGAIDLLRLAVDPVAQAEFAQKAWPVAVKLAKEAYISKFGTPAEIQDQDERAIAFAKDSYTKVKESFQKDWEEAGKTEGKRTELATKWASRGVFEIAALFVGAGEVKAAMKGAEVVSDVGKLEEAGAILDEVAQPCKTVVMSNEEILAEQAAKEAEDARLAFQQVVEDPKGARGRSSGRDFDPEKAGGPIRQLTTEGVNVSHDGIDAVERHLARFGPDKANEAMVGRLRDIANGKLAPTPADLNFYTHELDELARYTNLGYPIGQPADLDAAHELWNNTHTAALEDYGLTEGPGVLYHPDATKK